PALQAARRKLAGLDRGEHRAPWLALVRAVGEPAAGRELVDLGEDAADPLAGLVEADPADAGRVDDHSAPGERDELAVHGGVPPPAVAGPHLLGRHHLLPGERVDEGGLA